MGQLLPGVLQDQQFLRDPQASFRYCPHYWVAPRGTLTQDAHQYSLAILDALVTGDYKGGDFVLGRGPFGTKKVGEGAEVSCFSGRCHKSGRKLVHNTEQPGSQ